MTLSLWMLLAFAGWTLLVLLAGVGVPRWSLILTGRATLTSFPGDTAHGGVAYRRAVRAHANCVENLPVFAAIVLTAAVAHVTPPHFGALALVTMVGRVGHTSIHMALPETIASVALRFSCFLVQVLAMIAMGALVAVVATAGA